MEYKQPRKTNGQNTAKILILDCENCSGHSLGEGSKVIECWHQRFGGGQAKHVHVLKCEVVLPNIQTSVNQWQIKKLLKKIEVAMRLCEYNI